MPIIETTDLGQRREGVDILRHIDLSIERGEVFALIGPTGSGKTTLLRLLDLLDAPAHGRLRFDGVDVTESARDRHEARRRMAFVLQKPVVFNASVYDNVARGLRWRGLPRAQARSRVDDVLEMVGLEDQRDRRARTLSGGEMQRVAIARAIAIEPEVLLLDEPTASLDPPSALRVEDLIADIIRRYHTTIVMATHDLPQGERLATRAAVLLDGEIHQDDRWSGLLNSPRTRAIADFVGMANVLDGVITAASDGVATVRIGDREAQALSDLPTGTAVSLCVRAEEVTLALDSHSSSARNSFSGGITHVVAAGPVARVMVDCGFPLEALVTRRSSEEMGLQVGRSVFATFKATAVHVIRRVD
jgi:tungstate transport system ATP-binding protein